MPRQRPCVDHQKQYAAGHLHDVPYSSHLRAASTCSTASNPGFAGFHSSSADSLIPRGTRLKQNQHRMDARQPHATLRPLLALSGQRHQAVCQDTEQRQQRRQQSGRPPDVDLGKTPLCEPDLRRTLGKQAVVSRGPECGVALARRDVQRPGASMRARVHDHTALVW